MSQHDEEMHQYKDRTMTSLLPENHEIFILTWKKLVIEVLNYFSHKTGYNIQY